LREKLLKGVPRHSRHSGYGVLGLNGLSREKWGNSKPYLFC